MDQETESRTSKPKKKKKKRLQNQKEISIESTGQQDKQDIINRPETST